MAEGNFTVNFPRDTFTLDRWTRSYHAGVVVGRGFVTDSLTKKRVLTVASYPREIGDAVAMTAGGLVGVTKTWIERRRG
jgi:hypothetical protein